MDLTFSPEDEQLRDTMRRFALERLLPAFPDWHDGWAAELGALGALGIPIAPEYGGMGGTFVQLGIVGEELCRGSYSVNYLVQMPGLVGGLLAKSSEAVKRRWLPTLAAGEALAAFGLTEPEVGSDAANLRCRAEIRGDEIILNGEKASISFAGNADISVIFARTGGAGARGVSAIAVPLDTPGVTREVYRSVGTEPVQRGGLRFDDVAVPLDHLCGEEGTGFIGAMQGFDYNRALIALCSIGTAQQTLDETIAYAKVRETFGKALARHEGVAFQIAEHLALLHSARLLAYEVLDRADRGLDHTTQAAMAKWLGPKYAAEAIHACIRLYGWPAYGRDMPFDQRLRDVIGLKIGDGTPEIMKGIIARETFGREFTSYR